MGYEDDWFSVEELDHDTYAISEYKPWEETHCYGLFDFGDFQIHV